MTNHLRPRSVALITLAFGVAATLAAWLVVGRQAELRLGCYRAQGYLLSRPMPAHAIARLLRAGAVRAQTA